MKTESKASKAYCSEVSKALICERKKKRAILIELKANAEEFLSENPMAGVSELQKMFGTPGEIAESAMTGEDLRSLKRKTTVRRVVIAALIVALLIWFAFAVASLIDVHEEARGYTEEVIMTISSFAKGGQ